MSIIIKIVITSLVLIVTAILMFHVINTLLKVPGNKKILRKYPEDTERSKKGYLFPITLMVGAIILAQIIVFRFL